MDYVQPHSGRGRSIDDLSFFAFLKHKLHRKPSLPNKKRNVPAIILSSIIVSSCAVFVGWRLFIWQPANINPFTTELAASLQFPLYHPTYVPTGFHVDTKSVTQPTTGVIVFALNGPSKEKIFISEEARPTKYDIGGFFAKFSDLKESAIANGTVATGKIANGQTEVGSYLNNKVWIISNTNAPVPMNQMTQLVKGLSSNVIQ